MKLSAELAVDRDRLSRELDELGAISSEPSPVVTRVVFSEADLRARAFMKTLCAEVGLEIREDAVGNTFARWRGADAEAAAVGTGSHIDAIPNAGRFDGTVGVLGGLEAIRTLQRAGYKPRRSIELLIFTSEEPTRFGVGCLGSRLLAGAMAPTVDESLKDGEGSRCARSAHMRDSPGRLLRFFCLRAIIPRSSSCTLSKARNWNSVESI